MLFFVFRAGRLPKLCGVFFIAKYVHRFISHMTPVYVVKIYYISLTPPPKTKIFDIIKRDRFCIRTQYTLAAVMTAETSANLLSVLIWDHHPIVGITACYYGIKELESHIC